MFYLPNVELKFNSGIQIPGCKFGNTSAAANLRASQANEHHNIFQDGAFITTQLPLL